MDVLISTSPDTLSISQKRRWGAVRRWFRVQWTFVKFAALFVGEMLGLRRLAWRLRGARGAYVRITGPVAWRLAFEELGPTYIKLGQMVASGDGLFPRRYAEEFRKCLDNVPSFGLEAVEAILREDFGRPKSEIFATFDPEPAAAASIAQVHYARLRTGEEVVVKVQRPGIAERMRDDVAIMHLLARVLAAVVPHVKLANPVAIVEDLERTLFEELDFRREARNMDEFNAIMAAAGNTEVVAPTVYWGHTRGRVLTMERFRGWRVDDTEALLGGPYDAEAKLLAGIRGWFQCMLLRGFFHGDVHAGNFMLLEDGRVGFLDFGIIGRFDDAQKLMIAEYVLSFQTRDFERLAAVLVRMGSVDAGNLDRDAFTRDLTDVFTPMVNATAEFKIKDILPDMMRVSIKHRMRMPREFVLVTKQLVYLDRYAKAIGGPTMNVLTDSRVMGFLMEDMVRFAS